MLIWDRCAYDFFCTHLACFFSAEMHGALGFIWVGHHHAARIFMSAMLDAIACIEQDLFFSGHQMSFPPCLRPLSSSQTRRRSLIMMSFSHRRARDPGGAISSAVGMATKSLWLLQVKIKLPKCKNYVWISRVRIDLEIICPLATEAWNMSYIPAGKWQPQSCCNDDAMKNLSSTWPRSPIRSSSKNIPSPIHGVDNGIKPSWMKEEPHKPHSHAGLQRPSSASAILAAPPAWCPDGQGIFNFLNAYIYICVCVYVCLI